MTTHNFSLDKSSKKFNCPACGQKRFVLYVNATERTFLSEVVGRCDRELSCGHHYTPKQYFTDNGMPSKSSDKNDHFKKASNSDQENNTPISFLPVEIMDQSVSNCYKSDLFNYLASLFRYQIAESLSMEYFIGTNKNKETVFWQVDINGNVRQAKVISYLQNGHRDKEKILNSWVDKEGIKHETKGVFFAGKKILNEKISNIQQCFFGEFLLSIPGNEDKPIALVESEKTAVIASVYYPEFIWLATGGKHGAKWTEKNVCKVLAGKNVVLFPDLGAFDTWKTKGLLMAAVAGCKVIVSDLLEKNANDEDRVSGLDLADYLLKLQDGSDLALLDGPYPVMWDYKSGFKSQQLQQ